MEKYEIQKVQCVRYKLVQIKPVAFAGGQPEYNLEDENVSFFIKDNTATIILKKEINTIKEAKAIGLHYTAGMETLWHIQYGGPLLTFEYIHADIVVQYPSTGEIRSKRRLESFITFNVVEANPQPIVMTINSEQDAMLVASPTVLLLANRYKQYLQKQESLLSMGYYCFTVIKNCIENAVPKDKYGIDAKVMIMLSKLTSVLGDAVTARKISANRTPTKTEIEWMEKVIKRIMLQIAHVEAGKNNTVQRIGMADLPDLNDFANNAL